ncbi:MAG TPA: hypothetical protein VEF90_16490 [Xanthobacteraceae bacterium]|nr:hypothetical protein [Xanthobacteraceae bacterium]
MTILSNITVGAPPTAAPSPAPLSPTQAIVADANRVEYATDSKGRNLGVVRFNASLRRRVLKALSAENGDKGQYFVMAATACCCVSIDGVPVPFPTTELQVDALIDRLDQEGLEAIAITIAEKFSSPREDSVKNS